MHKPRYQTVGGQPVYRELRWWQRIFGHQPRYVQTRPATDADNNPPATSSDA